MTREDDFIGQLEGYLDEYEGITPLPSGVRDAIRAEVPKTRQIGPLIRLMRELNIMGRPAQLAIAAGAVVFAAAVIGASLLASGVGGPLDSTPTPTGTPLPLATPGALPAAGLLEPGTYVMDNPYIDDDPVRSCDSGCSDYQSISITVPEGWAIENGLIFKHLDQPNEVALSVWTPGDVYLDPCRWEASAVGPPGNHTDGSGGIVVEDHFPLLNQVGRTASTPVIVTLGGERTLRIELSLPADFDVAACDQGEFRSWSEWDVQDGANSHHAAGQIDVVYFVDVDRRALYIDASHRSAASEEDLAELEEILASMLIDRGF
jgi:hypothetical protein